MEQTSSTQPFDALIIGAGFGGMGAALALAERGARVAICETLRYPGGCASTFTRDGYQFEAGATLFSGFAEGQLFRRWIDRHDMDVSVDWIDPLVELRTPEMTLSIPRDREALIARFCAMPGAPVEALRAFFARQGAVADVLWELFDDPSLLPPFRVSALMRHVARAPRYLPLLGLIGRPLERVLHDMGLASFKPLRVYLDALCQITVQTSVAEAEAPFAMAAIDYLFHGTGHVRGGVGQLAWGMLGAIERAGGQVLLANRVRRLEPCEEGWGGWRVHTRRGVLKARTIIANLLPQNVRQLTGAEPGHHNHLDRLAAQVKRGWGAAMLYLAIDGHALPDPHAHHFELVQDPDAPFTEGNHLFCSLSAVDETARAPHGQRTATLSTHVPLRRLRAMDPEAQAAYIAQVQDRMRQGVARFLPELWRGVVHQLSASPRTFERFTSRHQGYVGGIPRRAGLHNYRDFLPRPVLPHLYLVGDTIFPGQSTLATAIGGLKLAEHLVARAHQSNPHGLPAVARPCAA